MIDTAQPFEQVLRLVLGQPVLIEQGQDAVNDLVLGLGEQVGLREGGLRDLRLVHKAPLR